MQSTQPYPPLRKCDLRRNLGVRWNPSRSRVAGLSSACCCCDAVTSYPHRHRRAATARVGSSWYRMASEQKWLKTLLTSRGGPAAEEEAEEAVDDACVEGTERADPASSGTSEVRGGVSGGDGGSPLRDPANDPHERAAAPPPPPPPITASIDLVRAPSAGSDTLDRD